MDTFTFINKYEKRKKKMLSKTIKKNMSHCADCNRGQFPTWWQVRAPWPSRYQQALCHYATTPISQASAWDEQYVNQLGYIKPIYQTKLNSLNMTNLIGKPLTY